MKRLEWYFHIFAFVLQCGGIVPLLLRSGDDSPDLGTSNPLNTIATAFILAVTLFLLLRHGRDAVRYLPRMWPIVGLALLALASIAWSEYPDVTLRRAVSLLTAALWAWYLASRYNLKDVVAMARQATGLMAISSLVIAVGMPSMGGEDPIGPAGWRGIFATKNDLGMVMAIGTITYFYTLVTARPRFRALAIQLIGLVLCAGLLYLARSSTCWLITMLGMVLCLAVKATHKRVGVAIIIWAGIVLLLAPAVIIATNQLAAIAPLLGRDAQLTGRVDLWLILPSYIAEHPWLGFGLGGFWVADSENVALIWDAIGWNPPHAHEGWLDLLLELGIVGLALLSLQILQIVVRGIRAVVDGREPDSQYLIVTTFILLIYNISESNLVRPGIMWVLLIIASTALAKLSTQRKPVVAKRWRYGGFQRPTPISPGGAAR